MYKRERSWKIRDDDTIFEMMRLYSNQSANFETIINDMTRMYDFTIAALQWDKDVKASLNRERRPAFSFNLTVSILNTILSVERDNLLKGKAYPRTGGDNKLAEVISQTLDFYLYKANFRKAQRRVMIDVIVAGLGVYHTGWKYNGSEDDRGQLFIEAVDPREILFEPNFNDPTGEDTSFIIRKHSMSLEEILNTFALNDEELYASIRDEAKVFFQEDMKRDKWISKKLKALFSAVYETALGYSGGRDNLFTNYLQWWDPATGKFDILELHEKRMERRLLVPNNEKNKLIDITDIYWNDYKEKEAKEPDGYTFNNELIDNIKKRYNLEGEARTNLFNRRFTTTVIPTFNLKVNEQPYPFESKHFVYILQQCYDYHPDPTKVHSIISDLIDPQQGFNKARSLIIELVGRYADAGWIVEEGAIDGLLEDWTSNRIAKFRRVRDGSIGRIKPMETPKISQDLVRMPIEMENLMQTISNAINTEISGARNPEVKSGRHFAMKEQRQTKSFTYILENKNMTAKAVYELALQFIQNFVTTQTVIRIVEDTNPNVNQEIILNQSRFSIENGQIAERVINDIDAYEYDIEINEQPFSATAQEERYSKLSDLFNATLAINPQKADAILPILVEAGNFPDKEKILTVWQQMGQASPEQMQMQQLAEQIQVIMAKLGIEEKAEDLKSKKLGNLERTKNLISPERKTIEKPNIQNKNNNKNLLENLLRR